jgi:flavin reductase (DIM6/NTAB) family NADH-FMN oxidoreductase RutF
MQLDFAELEPLQRYKLLSATVIPRPIAWVTTRSAEGVVNAAPYSFFNVFSEDPALIVLGLQHRDGVPKDTTRNIHQTGEFVVNIATPAAAPAMVDSAAAYAPEASETDALGLETLPSLKVAPPRLACAAVALECRRHVALAFGPQRELMIGEVVAMAARPGLIDPATLRVEWDGDYPLARLFADRYARLEEIEPRAIPAPPEAKP